VSGPARKDARHACVCAYVSQHPDSADPAAAAPYLPTYPPTSLPTYLPSTYLPTSYLTHSLPSPSPPTPASTRYGLGCCYGPPVNAPSFLDRPPAPAGGEGKRLWRFSEASAASAAALGHRLPLHCAVSFSSAHGWWSATAVTAAQSCKRVECEPSHPAALACCGAAAEGREGGNEGASRK
jgi:hypothetical protein